MFLNDWVESCRNPFEEFSSHQYHHDTKSEGRGNCSGDKNDYIESQNLSDMYGDLQGVVFPTVVFPQTTWFCNVMALIVVAAVASAVVVIWEQRKKRTSHECMVG